MPSKILILLSLWAFLLSSCGTFRGPGELTTPQYRPTAAATTEPNPKKAKIESELDKTSSEPFDDESNSDVFDKLPAKKEKSGAKADMHFDWPVDEAKLSRGFINQKRKHHWGLDLANKKDTPILATESGYVVYTGRQFHGYGKLIVIEHNDQWASLYGHLNDFLVKEGEYVKKGQPIAKMGRTGHATGSHLHFEIRDNRKPVDPLVYLPAQE